MKGIILAAGDGGRLKPLTLDTPKVLLEVAGQPLIHYPIQAMRQAGISEIAVVVGYRAEDTVAALQADYPFLRFIMNEAYEGENALSVLAASHFVSDEPFLVSMGDHPIGVDIVQRLLLDATAGSLLCVDRLAELSPQTSDATRVLVGGDGYISAIGKDLERWNAVDTGVFRMNRDVIEAVEHLVIRRGSDVGITDVVRYMGSSGSPFATCDVSGMVWGDVDTPSDYHFMDSLLRGEYGERL